MPKLLAGGVNPVREANPASLDKLFADDPLGFANVDLSLRVAQPRRVRDAWTIAAKLEADRAAAAKLAITAERQALRDAAKAERTRTREALKAQKATERATQKAAKKAAGQLALPLAGNQ